MWPSLTFEPLVFNCAEGKEKDITQRHGSKIHCQIRRLAPTLFMPACCLLVPVLRADPELRLADTSIR